MINEQYLTEEMETQLAAHFSEQRSISLQQFFSDDALARIEQEISSLSLVKKKDPLHYSYSLSDFSPKLQEWFSDPHLIAFVQKIIGKKPADVQQITGQYYCFSWKDYTLLHDSKTNNRTVHLLFNIDSWDDTYGGAVTYTDGQGNHETLVPTPNTLSIVDCSDKQFFVKYVNHHAQEKERRFILITL